MMPLSSKHIAEFWKGKLMVRRRMSTPSLAVLHARINNGMARISKLTAKLGKISAELEKLLEMSRKTQPAKRGRPPKKRGPGRSAKAASEKSGGGKKNRNKISLGELLIKVLSKKKPMPIAAIVKAVKAAGYKSKSPQFTLLVNQSLSKAKDTFKTVGRGVYTLA